MTTDTGCSMMIILLVFDLMAGIGRNSAFACKLRGASKPDSCTLFCNEINMPYAECPPATGGLAIVCLIGKALHLKLK